MQHYFLMDRGDLMLGFMDLAEAELNKSGIDVSLPHLQSLLDMGAAGRQTDRQKLLDSAALAARTDRQTVGVLTHVRMLVCLSVTRQVDS
jgi:hypothetical protein